ncbi:Triosephosphate isomerase [Buchnera aphidicola (Cinara piceae)]|uniref:Triosephosphate isomerase n=1 Tax=Buchnera aphidicola (Cinara piceae) TaxID=1660043 RepID=A0A803GCM8_9GAMM|nr:triose-phosphate isomerase [Buchnera aphidicola]VFP88319.1 Triosephosphate isomerase [Buchnera aphidicola (Cinara piceae)]
MIKPIIVGNWKLNGNKIFIRNFFQLLNQFLNPYHKKCTTIITPPILYIPLIQKILFSDKKNFFLGSQNVDIHTFGPFTGEVSPCMLTDIGIKHVIIGHSERRFNHKESNTLIAKKFHILKENKLIPILCIGETKEEKINKKTKEICKKQIDIIFDICGAYAFDNSIIAYEPIWAIGSNHSAKPKEAQYISYFIRNYIKSKITHKIKNFFIQYGGSVTDKNAQELILQNDIDGFLVGGASLKIKEFTKIIEIANM